MILICERKKKKYSCIMTCSHFCSNNYCLIDVDVLTKPTVLWIFIDLFNFWSLLHIIGRWYLEVYIDVRYGLSLYSDSFNKLEIILLFFCQETVFVIYRENVNRLRGLFMECFILQRMCELQATLEFSIEFNKFFNVDLFQRG